MRSGRNITVRIVYEGQLGTVDDTSITSGEVLFKDVPELSFVGVRMDDGEECAIQKLYLRQHIQLSDTLEEDVKERLAINHEDPDVEPEDQMSRADVLQEMMQNEETATATRRKELRDIGIKLGVYSRVTPQQVANTVTTPGGKKYDFKHEGRLYVFASWDPLFHDAAL